MADESDNQSTSSNEDLSNETSESPKEAAPCVKVPLPQNIAAYLAKRELLRESETLPCESVLAAEVTGNYVIAQKILSNLPWQDKLVCKNVCTTWRAAIKVLQKEQLYPADFALDFKSYRFLKSSNFFTEPLVVFTFANLRGLSITCYCSDTLVHPYPWAYRFKKTIISQSDVDSPLCCTPPCKQNHCPIDLVEHYVCAPKHCMLTVKAGYLSYLPVYDSPTYEHTISHHMFVRPYPFICGVYIPVIPDVEFHIINIKSNTNMQQDFFDEIDRISRDRIFKGVIVYVTETFLLHSVEDFDYFDYFKNIQPDVPYALGGCIVEDTMYGESDINNVIEGVNSGNDIVSENLITIAMFTVPKTSSASKLGDKYNFDMYSLVVESSDNTRSKIQKTITEFSNKVPRFEHSLVLKLSCVGRDQRHDLEQKYFREAFPNTSLIGCYGNGELGINHPPRQVPDAPPRLMKRKCPDQRPQSDIMYSYATVFVYIGWGRITSVRGPV